MAPKNEDPRPDAPDPWVVLDRLAAALETGKTRLEAAPADSVNLEALQRMTEALGRVSEAQMRGAELIASETRRAHRPSNEIVHQRSPFNPRGVLLREEAEGPRKPPLKCPMLIPYLVEWDSITREEAELLNLLEAGEYQYRLIDRSMIRVQVKVDMDVTGTKPSRLLLDHVAPDGTKGTAFNNSNFRLIPPLVEALRFVLRQHRPEVVAAAAAVMSDEEEAALIQSGLLEVSR